MAVVLAGVLPVVMALVHVHVTVGAVESRQASATVTVTKRGAGGVVTARLARTIVRLLAMLS